jgi:hypothetical protein
VSITAAAVLLSFDVKLFILPPIFNEFVLLTGKMLNSVVRDVIKARNLPVVLPARIPVTVAPL